MAILKQNPSLKDFQNYIQEIEIERGFKDETILQSCLLLGEEVGELFKSVRKLSGIKTDTSKNQGNTEEEIADVFMFVLSLANKLDINLEEAFRNKEAINNKRTWN